MVGWGQDRVGGSCGDGWGMVGLGRVEWHMVEWGESW